MGWILRRWLGLPLILVLSTVFFDQGMRLLPTLAALVICLQVALPPKRLIRFSVTAAVFSFFLVLLSFEQVAQIPVSSDVIWQNLGEIFTFGFLQILTSSLSPTITLVAVLALLGLIVSEFPFRLISGWGPKTQVSRSAVYLAAFVPLATTLLESTEPAIQTTHNTPRFAEKEFPYLHKNQLTQTVAKKTRPNIFLIWVESFNANFVQKRNELGKEYTPFFNSLISKGIYAERFYGQSVQTPRGQIASLCSILPSYQGKIFKSLHNRQFRCLSQILEERGYDTYFFKAFHDLKFDRTGRFAKKIGFHHVRGMDPSFISKSDKKNIWGWGLEDRVFYRKFFKYVDENRKPSQPLFATLTTVSNHQNFSWIPKEQRYLYANPVTPEQRYANSIHLTDRYLKSFFAELNKRDDLKNSLVILMGDHSIPVGEQGIYHNMKGHFEPTFRTPFLALWPSKLKARTLRVPSSQLDVAPTVLDLLGIQETVPFMGESLFLERKRPIPMVQPYDGTHLVTVRFPLKYVRELKSGKEFIYNLKTDPLEKTNHISLYRLLPIYKDFLEDTEMIRTHQKLLKEDRIWPAPRQVSYLR